MNVLYGVVGEGMGHATRSSVVINHLLAQGHAVKVLASGRANTFLRERFPDVERIHGLHIVYDDNVVQRRETVISNLLQLPTNLTTNVSQYLALIGSFAPDVVISDFDSFAWMFAQNQGLPVISIDNMQIINRCRHDDLPPESQADYRLTKALVKAKLPGCAHYFITTFFSRPVRKRRTTLVPPILRDSILNARPTDGDHVLVYQTSPTFQALLPALQAMTHQRFEVYGFNRDEDLGNVRLHRFSEAGFIQNLASARAVITNAGFTLLSEAVHLRKPVLCVPVAKQFEQVLNGHAIYTEGFGESWERLDADLIVHFLENVPRYRAKLQGYSPEGNERLFFALDETLTRLARGEPLPDTFGGDEQVEDDPSTQLGR